MENLTFWRCVRGAWADGLNYMRLRPLLVLAFFLPSWVAPYVEAILRPHPHPPFRFLVWVPLAVFEVVRFGFVAALAVDVLRFLLLPERPAVPEPLFGRSFWRYLGVTWALLFALVVLAAIAVVFALGVVFVLMLSHVHAPLSVPLLVGGAAIVSQFLGIFLVTRLSLLSTHVAIGGSVRIAEAWRDSRGRFWRLWLTQAVATLPLLLLARIAMHTPLAMARPGGISALFEALADVAGACIGGACAAWLYRIYAQRLRGLQPSAAG
ncbi:hypothetical protein [Paraburkholderia sp. J8-2]|uniref:hypothetical protein n=1 Tax=Paraburkholderia sp. J8-2 TaxID=2805440 RepID=UPI002AB73B24|nr:hypothetical protein [Paraburkholderia sp. J8-2]